MGCICPLQRDHKPHTPLPTHHSRSLPSTLSNESQSEDFCQDVNLRGDESVIRLTRPLAYYYKLTGEATGDGGVLTITAQFFGSLLPCCIHAFPKQHFRLQAVKKTAILHKLMKIDHPTVLKTYEITQDDQYLYIVQESTTGGSLSSHLDTHGFLTEVQAQHTVRQVLSGLSHCHQLGIVHRSVSLTDILIKEQSGEGLFNIRLAGVENFDLQLCKDWGSSPFSAPEVTHGQFTEKGDVWSCGVLLYYCLSGRNPFESLETAQVAKRFTFPNAVWGEINPAAIDLIVKMLVKRQENRLTAMECMQHPWLKTGNGEICGEVKGVLWNMVGNKVETPLKKAIMLFMIERVVDQGKVEQLARTFSALDTDGNGFISKSELVHGLQTFFSEDSTESIAKRIIAKFDQNFNGEIDFSEFLLAAFDPEVLLSQTNLKRAFRSLDRDSSGKISSQELKHFFRINNSSGSIDQWKLLIASFDLSGDGEIDYLEFESLMTKSA